MNTRRLAPAIALLSAAGCQPDFPRAECFEDTECGPGAVCVSRACVAAVDAADGGARVVDGGGDAGPGPDGGRSADAATPDGGRSADAATPDGGRPADAATPDGGRPADAATPDGGGPADAATPDGGGPADAATPDGGRPADAATPDGGGPADAATPDGGGPADAATPDPPDAAPDGGPERIGHWTFSPGAERVDRTGHWDPLTLQGTARVADGALWVDGYLAAPRGFAHTSGWRHGAIREKTYVAWVSMRGLDGFGGAALSLVDRGADAHDALLWGHLARHGWSAATGGLRPGGPFLARHTDEVTRQVVLSWVDLGGPAEVVLCLDGVEVARAGTPLRAWGDDAMELLIGTTDVTTSNRGGWTIGGLRSEVEGGLKARIDEVQLYRGAMTCAQAGALTREPDSPPDPAPPPASELIGQWSFTPGAERADNTGRWDALELYGDRLVFEDGWLSGGFGADGFARAVGWQGDMIRDKTFVAWLEHTDLEPHGGAVVALDSRHPREVKFDALSYWKYAEGTFWVPVSDGREQPNAALRGRHDRVGVPYQVAASWEDVGDGRVRITLCYDGARVGSLERGPMADWREDAEVLIGIRGLTWQVNGPHLIDGERQLPLGYMDARIDEVRLYRGALSCEAVGALRPAP